MRGCVILLTVPWQLWRRRFRSFKRSSRERRFRRAFLFVWHWNAVIAIKRVGEPIQGRLVDPGYVFDRVVFRPEAS